MIPSEFIRTKADELAVEQGCYFDEEEASDIIAFANVYFKPQYISKKFILLDWQRKFLMSLYGWKTSEGKRRFRSANLHISKKNGKTLITSIICLYELFRSNEPSPFIASGSVSRENAAQVFSEIRHSIIKNKLEKQCNITAFQKKIYNKLKNSEYRSLAADGDTAQGFNCSLVLLDECHAHKSSSLYDSLKYSTASRPNGLFICISTAGDDPSHWYHKVYSKSKRILNGDDLDITHYAEVYEADPDSDINDRTQWYKANPSMGVSFSEELFAQELKACSDPSEVNRFRRYRLNQWIRADETAFFDLIAWDKCFQDIPPDEKILKFAPLFVGVDLSQTTDPSSVTSVWLLPDNTMYCKTECWVARQGVINRQKSNLPRYEQFTNEGCMTQTQGDMIDAELILKHLQTLYHNYNSYAFVFDPTSAFAMMGLMQAEGAKCFRCPTSASFVSAPMKELHKAIDDRQIRHDGNNWTRYCLSNVRIKETQQGAIHPHRESSLDKIDGAISLILAYSECAKQIGETQLITTSPISFA